MCKRDETNKMPSKRAIRLLNDDLSPNVSSAVENITSHMFDMDKTTPNDEVSVAMRKALSDSFSRSCLSFLLKESSRKEERKMDEFSRAKRNGRGRKTSLVPIRPPNLDSLMRNIAIESGTGLRPKHIKIIRDYCVENVSRKEIAERYGMSSFAIQYILTLPGAREMIARFQESTLEDINQINKKALDNARAFLDSPKEDIKLDMTKFVLSRSTALPKSEVLHRVTGADGVSPVEVISSEREAKTKLLTRSGIDPTKIIEAEYAEVK